MASRRGISYLWRIFLPYVLSLWVVIIGMGSWQAYRVSTIKKNMVYDQLNLISTRIADLYNAGNEDVVVDYMLFVNHYYQHSKNYDPISIQVRDEQGKVLMRLGSVIPSSYRLPGTDEDEDDQGVMRFKGIDTEGKSVDQKFVYSTEHTNQGYLVCVMLPYTKEISVAVAAVTTKFWLIFIGIAIFATIFAYIWALFFSQNIRILRDFASRAAEKRGIVEEDFDFPHDELGDISRQILHIYNQRIDEMRQREKEHRIALNAIEEKQRMKKELTGNINHELKTPVGVIQGYLDTIMDDPDMDDYTRRKFLEKAQQNVHRLTALINDITTITRLESGGKLVNVEEIDYHDLAFTFDNYVREANVLPTDMDFRYDVPLNCKVMGNESLLSAVLMNFTKNAAAYSRGTLCKLECTGQDDDFYYFRFFDNGVGVSPEHLPHMFERFYRVNSGRSRDTGGTGLGLAIVAVTITSLGGEISVQNHIPSGLEFRFSLRKHKSNKA